MQTLTRQVRFCINPLLDSDPPGDNSFAGRPAGVGLALYFALTVELKAKPDPDTGLIVNVTDIDRSVRSSAVPVFADALRKNFRKTRHTSYQDLFDILGRASRALRDKFDGAELLSMALALSPFRKIKISGDGKVNFYSEKFEFAAAHRLWNDKFSEQENYRLFGKCANPAVHGHNYILEVTIKCDPGSAPNFGGFQEVIKREFIDLVDHRNLNTEIDYFGAHNPTVENIAAFACEKLSAAGLAGLHCVTVWETDRTSSCCFVADRPKAAQA